MAVIDICVPFDREKMVHSHTVAYATTKRNGTSPPAHGLFGQPQTAGSANAVMAADRLDAAGAVECAEAFPATLSGPFHGRLTASARARPLGQLRLMPKRSGAAEGVGDARGPAPVQIDHSGRRGPFSGL